MEQPKKENEESRRAAAHAIQSVRRQRDALREEAEQARKRPLDFVRRALASKEASTVLDQSAEQKNREARVLREETRADAALFEYRRRTLHAGSSEIEQLRSNTSFSLEPPEPRLLVEEIAPFFDSLREMAHRKNISSDAIRKLQENERNIIHGLAHQEISTYLLEQLNFLLTIIRRSIDATARHESNTGKQDYEACVQEMRGSWEKLPSKMNALRQSILRIYEGALGSVGQHMESEVQSMSIDAFDAIDHMLFFGDPFQQRFGNAVLKQHLRTIENICTTEYPLHGPYHPVLYALRATEHGDAEITTLLKQLLQNILEKHSLQNPKNAQGFFQELGSDLMHEDIRPGVKRKNLQKEIIDHFLQAHGINVETARRIWSDSKAFLGTGHECENLASMYEIDASIPGGVRRLNQEFGIYCFDRYPSEMLIAQAREVDNAEKPYGVLVAGLDDHGFYDSALYGAKEELRSMHEELYKHGYLIRVIEVEDKVRLLQKLVHCKKRYGQKQKISIRILFTHGGPDGFTLGRIAGVEQRVTVADMETPEALRAKDLFTEDAPTVLISCFTGTEGGIAQKISNVWSADVEAPNRSIKVPKIILTWKDGKPKFTLRYREGEVGEKYSKGKRLKRH